MEWAIVKSPIRDSILFGVGLAGIAWETTIADPADPQLLVLFAAMIGLPLVRRADGQ